MMIFTTPSANKMMVDYVQQGLDYIIFYYSIKDIEAMYKDEVSEDNRNKLLALIACMEKAKEFRQIIVDLFHQWDEDEYNNQIS